MNKQSDVSRVAFEQSDFVVHVWMHIRCVLGASKKKKEASLEKTRGGVYVLTPIPSSDIISSQGNEKNVFVPSNE